MLRTVAPASRAVVGGRGRKYTGLPAVSGPRPLIREKGPSFSSFCAASPPLPPQSLWPSWCWQEREKIEALSSEHWNAAYSELELAASLQTLCPVSTSLCIGSPSPGRGYWEKKGRNRKMQYCSSGTLYSGLFSHAAYLQSPWLVPMLHAVFSGETVKWASPRYLEPTLHLFWECGFFFLVVLGLRCCAWAFCQEIMGTDLQLRCTGFTCGFSYGGRAQ